MHRTREYRRTVRKNTIKRRKNIAVKRDGQDWYDCDGKYSKGKIHCNCGQCKPGRMFDLPNTRMKRELDKFRHELSDYERTA